MTSTPTTIKVDDGQDCACCGQLANTLLLRSGRYVGRDCANLIDFLGSRPELKPANWFPYGVRDRAGIRVLAFLGRSANNVKYYASETCDALRMV